MSVAQQLLGINLVLTEVVINGTIATLSAHEDASLVVALGNLQPQVVALKQGNGCFSLCGDAAGRVELLSGCKLPVRVLVLSKDNDNSNVLSKGNDSDEIELPQSPPLHLYPPQQFLQLPFLVLTHASLYVPLVRAQGVATSTGFIKLAVCIFDMSQRAIDALHIAPTTGRIALRRHESQEKQRQAQRALPADIETGARVVRRTSPGDDDSEKRRNDDDDDDDDVDDDVDDEGVDELVRSLDGILTGTRPWLSTTVSVDSLQLGSILRQPKPAPMSDASEVTLSLDDVLAEMERERLARDGEVARALAAQKEAMLAQQRREDRAVTVNETKTKTNAKAKGRGTPKIKAAKGVLSTQPVRQQQPPAQKQLQQGKGRGTARVASPPRTVSRIMVLVRRDELLLSAGADASPVPVSTVAEEAAGNGLEGLRSSGSMPLPLPLPLPPPIIVTQVDAATERRLLERQRRLSQSLPVVPPSPPSMVYMNITSVRRSGASSASAKKTKSTLSANANKAKGAKR